MGVVRGRVIAMSKAEAPRRGVVRSSLALAIATTLAVWSPHTTSAADTAWPKQVSARYRLQFNGFEVGFYDFTSRFSGNTYSATGKTRISALFGAFKWTGSFSGSGSLDGNAPHPANYQMNSKAKSKINSVTIGFDATGVASVALVPNKPPHPDAIPLKPDNLKHVFDPMAATLAISSTSAPEACNRTIPVFDGKARFDLKLSLKGREAIKDKQPTGQPAELIVCRVKYVPIAGHKPNDFVHPWIDYDHIEIALTGNPERRHLRTLSRQSTVNDWACGHGRAKHQHHCRKQHADCAEAGRPGRRSIPTPAGMSGINP